MKKIIAMLAICGATFAMSAQNNYGSGTNDKKNDQNTKTTYPKKDMSKGKGTESNGTYRNENAKSGMSETTYQQTPEQNGSSVEVPEKVKTAFNDQYYSKDIKPTWKKEGANYRASFKNGSMESVATYDKEGNLISSERQLGKNDYPTEIGSYFDKNPGSTQDYKVWEQNKNGAIKYYVKDNGRTTWFDKEGSHIAGNGTGNEENQHHVAHHKSSNYK